MAANHNAALRQRLVQGYQLLRERLARRLGRTDLACDVLHDTYLRLAQLPEATEVRSGEAYLFRTALNVANSRAGQERRLLVRSEVEELLQVRGDGLDPDELAGAREELRALARALESLSPRRRAILLAARVENEPHDQTAARYGISTRMVEKELRFALDHCARALGRPLVRRFGPDGRGES